MLCENAGYLLSFVSLITLSCVITITFLSLKIGYSFIIIFCCEQILLYLKYLENSPYLLSVVSIMTLTIVITITFFSLRVDAKNTPRGVRLIWGGATNFWLKWGENTFCSGMGGDRKIWPEMGVGREGKYHLSWMRIWCKCYLSY